MNYKRKYHNLVLKAKELYKQDELNGKDVLKQLFPNISDFSNKEVLELIKDVIKKSNINESDKIKVLSIVYKQFLPNGVYIVYKDGTFVRFSSKLPKSNIDYIGISYDGHRFGIPLDHDYGEVELLKSNSSYEYDDKHCVNEINAMYNWDFIFETNYLKSLGLGFNLKRNHYLPTVPVMVVVLNMIKEINEALIYANSTPISESHSYWTCQRAGVYDVWLCSSSSYFYSELVDDTNYVFSVCPFS